MDFHLLELFRREPAGLVDDVIRHRQLADVVQQGRGAKSIHVLLVQFQFLGYLHGIGAHAVQVLVGGVILGVDGQGQRLDGAQVERADLLPRGAFRFPPGALRSRNASSRLPDGPDTVDRSGRFRT
jgi:hypothetical protein